MCRRNSYSPLEDEDAPSGLVSLCSEALQLVGSLVSPGTSSLRLSFSSSEKQMREGQKDYEKNRTNNKEKTILVITTRNDLHGISKRNKDIFPLIQ